MLTGLASADVVHIACHGIGDSTIRCAAGCCSPLTHVWTSTICSGTPHSTGCGSPCCPPARRRSPGCASPTTVSLATGVLFSGAAGVIAALWAVPDAATREIMVEMHLRWRSGAGDAVAALRAAQDAMRTGDLGDGRWAHPADWAGFIYLGAQRPALIGARPLPICRRRRVHDLIATTKEHVDL